MLRARPQGSMLKADATSFRDAASHQRRDVHIPDSAFLATIETGGHLVESGFQSEAATDSCGEAACLLPQPFTRSRQTLQFIDRSGRQTMSIDSLTELLRATPHHERNK